MPSVYLVIAVVQVSRRCNTSCGSSFELLCLLGEQHVISGGVIVGIWVVQAVVNARCGCVCWLDDGWWADCMVDAKWWVEAIVNAQTSISLCLLVGEGTIEQLVDSVVDGGGKYSGELCKLVCRCQLMAVGNAAWNVEAVVYLVVNGSVENWT